VENDSKQTTAFTVSGKEVAFTKNQSSMLPDSLRLVIKETSHDVVHASKPFRPHNVIVVLNGPR